MKEQARLKMLLEKVTSSNKQNDKYKDLKYYALKGEENQPARAASKDNPEPNLFT